MIYHVTNVVDWEKARQAGCFVVPSLEAEGFIHMSKAHQVAGVLDRYYKNQSDLLLLHVDEQKLTSELKYDWSPSIQEEFPHIYGPINLDAVVTVEKLSN
jgi:uncharacterized protein (DUF952 family)